MNFTHLKAFYTVANNGSFTQAAQELHVSQSTLSMQVKSMEKYYDFTLFKRTKKGVDLTVEGDPFNNVCRSNSRLSGGINTSIFFTENCCVCREPQLSIFSIVKSILYICIFKPVFLFMGDW